MATLALHIDSDLTNADSRHDLEKGTLFNFSMFSQYSGVNLSVVSRHAEILARSKSTKDKSNL